MVEHTSPACTGNWTVHLEPSGPDAGRAIRCERCGAEHSATPGNRLAAIDENYAGIYLRRLTAEGATMLSTDQET